MANRSVYSILKGVPREDFPRVAIELAAELMKGPRPGSAWGDWVEMPTPVTFRAKWNDDTLCITNNAAPWAIELSRRYLCPLIELRCQESEHWDFGLFHSGEFIADFSTDVAYYDDRPSTPRPWRKGGPEDLERLWGVPLERLERYLVDWRGTDHRVQRGWKAYESDRFPYFDTDQLYDFMGALGAVEPWWTPDPIEFEALMWRTQTVEHPIHRRIIRRASVLARGSYPDVPARSLRQRYESWKRRRETRWLLKHHPEAFFWRPGDPED